MNNYGFTEAEWEAEKEEIKKENQIIDKEMDEPVEMFEEGSDNLVRIEELKSLLKEVEKE